MKKHRHRWSGWYQIFWQRRGKTGASYERACTLAMCDYYQEAKELRPIKPVVKRARR
jgi:hypothetical protein